MRIEQDNTIRTILFTVSIHLVHIRLRNSTVFCIVREQFPLCIHHNRLAVKLQDEVGSKGKGTGWTIKKTVSGILRPQVYAVTDMSTKLCRHKTLKHLLHREQEGKGDF